MKTVENGKVVQVHYTGTLENGDVFDSSRDREPLEVTIGQGQVISGFEQALIGMSVNEKKEIILPPEEAYGTRDEEAMRKFDRKEIPPGLDVETGQMVALSTPQGQQIPAKVVQADEESVMVDLNHPLAGQSLTFALEVVGISEQ